MVNIGSNPVFIVRGDYIYLVYPFAQQKQVAVENDKVYIGGVT